MARILLTAGPTRAFIDDVRFLTNASSGRMAAALAEAALVAGHEVVVVSGPVPVRYPQAARVVPVVTTREMLAAALAELPAADGVIAAAAPCDFEPAERRPGKIPRRGAGLTLELAPTPDVIATLAREGAPRQWFVAFALEPGGDPRRAFEKIEAKRCDLIVVNDVTALEGPETAVTVYARDRSVVGSSVGTKRDVAAWLVELVGSRLMR
ncbi:MAG: phosphopantothenoylcysteine decarboxylase [Planctomycetota bacterium]